MVKSVTFTWLRRCIRWTRQHVEVGWPLRLVQDDLVHCGVNGCRLQRVPARHWTAVETVPEWVRVKVGTGRFNVFQSAARHFLTGAVTSSLLWWKHCRSSAPGPRKDARCGNRKLAATVMCNAAWSGAVKWHHTVKETGSCGMWGHLLLQLRGWLAASHTDC